MKFNHIFDTLKITNEVDFDKLKSIFKIFKISDMNILFTYFLLNCQIFYCNKCINLIILRKFQLLTNTKIINIINYKKFKIM